jgi:hypothetical protein
MFFSSVNVFELLKIVFELFRSLPLMSCILQLWKRNLIKRSQHEILISALETTNRTILAYQKSATLLRSGPVCTKLKHV